MDDVSSDVIVSLRNPFSSSVSEMITTFSMSTYKVGLKVNPNEQDHRVPVLIWSTCAYTIQSIGNTHTHIHTHTHTHTHTHLKWVFLLTVCFSAERLLMDEEKPLFGSLPCRQVTHLPSGQNRY